MCLSLIQGPKLSKLLLPLLPMTRQLRKFRFPIHTIFLYSIFLFYLFKCILKHLNDFILLHIIQKI